MGGSHRAGGTVTAVVGNAPRRAVGGREVSREGRWKRERGTRMRGMGRKAGAAVAGAFLWRPVGAAEGKGRGLQLSAACRAGTRKGEGARARRGDSAGGVAKAGNGPTASRAGGAVWPHRVDPEADRWAAALVPGGGSG
jgi:hypothetical protein